MFHFVLRRGALISHKLSPSVTSSPRCWTSFLSPLSHHATASCFSSNHRSTGRLRPASYHPTYPVYSHPIHSSAVRLKKRPQPEPPPRELDLLRYDMRDLPKSPKPALYLGFSGLLPFVCPTLFMAVTENFIPEIAYAQVAYGASILSFLGGARWGFTLPPSSPAKPDWINLANSVVPSLLAWVAMLMSENIVPATTMVIMGLGIALHYDLALLPTYPSWFKALRSVLTVVASLSLLGMLVVYRVFPEKKLFAKDEDI
ncbi:transmembrane protein 69 [Periophthalmus magnuspinnatus]|uniref:transmembrane protein 69 n=1 Tax=Periophthalmus magnuspinnatus TaxID=409849 RepID=UPI00145B264C|nr:transmembrane protein 69 [Periophthalmus magnuspinnatus]